jgi:hypothetical protein
MPLKALTGTETDSFGRVISLSVAGQQPTIGLAERAPPATPMPLHRIPLPRYLVMQTK